MTRPELRKFLGEVWGCFCGSPDTAAAALLRMLRLHPVYEHRDAFDSWVASEGLHCLLLYTLNKWGLTEHGGTVFGGWLTTKGVAVRDALAAEEADGFESLFEQHCIHGVDIDDQNHDCMKASD